MTVQEWLGADNKLGIDIWENKYRYNNETFDEWLDRVSGGDDRVRRLIIEKKFLFGGRILANRGTCANGKKSTYSNCYVTGVDDSIESIYDACKKLARTFSYGGGVGLDISKLSPRGAKINNSAKETTGAVSFMETFSQVTDTIGQNGRRAALMLSISCDHPDLEEFIHIKDDLNKVNFANISVRVTDDFMKAVVNDEEWTMSFIRKETGETIERKASAKELFKSICKGNWNMAEPGVLFWDTIENWNLLSNTPNFKYGGVNPCVVGSTLISTTDGEIPIKDLVGQTPDVYCMDNDGNIAIRKAVKVWKTRSNAELVRVKTHRGCIICTPDHRIHTRSRGWVCAKDIKHGDRLTGLNRSMKDEIHCESINLNYDVGTNWFVDEVEFLNYTEDVYDMTVEEFHNFIADRIVVHNCAEEP